MSFTQVQLTVNPNRKSFIQSASVQSALQTRPILFSRETMVLCLSFVNDDGSVYALESDDEFECAIDSTRRHVTDTSDLMAYSDDTQVDIAGDWADISRANGKISIRVDCSRTLFEDRITESDGVQECWLQVPLTPSGESNATTMVQDLINCADNVINRYI
jgi:hypothetical protein